MGSRSLGGKKGKEIVLTGVEEPAIVKTEIGERPTRSPSTRTTGILAWMPARLRPNVLIPAVIVFIPAVLFYVILFRKALNIPLWDDYEVLLDFLNHMAGLSNASAKVSFFLSVQNIDYKLFFGHAIGWLQLALFGHIDFRLLCALGNGFVLLLAILLWKMFLPNQKNLATRLAFFIPVSWLLFELRYVEALNWATSSLFYVPALAFSFGAIYLLLDRRRRAYYGAFVCLILAIASFGNGLLMIPIGVLILALDRRYARLVGWLAVSAGCVVVYAYRYSIMPSRGQMNHSVLTMTVPPRLFFLVTFIGNAIGVPLYGRIFLVDLLLCFLLGVMLCVFFFAMARRGYIRKNPLVTYCVLFLLLTAVGVAGIRSDFGAAWSLSSRYGIYSVLLLIFAWFAIVEEFLQHEGEPLRGNRIWLGAVAASILFSLVMDVAGWHYLAERNRALVVGMAAYEHPTSPDHSVGPILPMANPNSIFEEYRGRAPMILRQSMNFGIYRPPAY